MSYPTIQFEGCTVAVIAPEDLEGKDAELDRLRRDLAVAREWIARAPHEWGCMSGAIDPETGTPCACTCGRDALLKAMEVPK